jgi:hypothetical protein
MSGFFHGAIAMTAIAATIPNNAKYGPKTASLLTGSVKPPTGAVGGGAVDGGS